MPDWLKPSNIAFAVAVIVCLTAVVLVAEHKSSSDHSKLPTAPSSAIHSSGPTATTGHADPPALQKSKARLNSQVQAFSKLYFSLSPTKSTAEIKREIAPYATKHFMATAPFGYAMYGSSEAGDSLRKDHATITATPVTGLTGEGLKPTTATGTIIVHVVKVDDTGSYDQGDKPQTISLVRQGNTWLVSSAPLT